MRLNADIIYENLVKILAAELQGEKENSLHLKRPEFYLEPGSPMLEDHVYLVRGSSLPQRIRAEKKALLICIGNSPYLEQYSCRCMVLRIRENRDIFEIFNILTQIYDRYESWGKKLHQILNSTANLQEMIACSTEIFENPIFVLNAGFRILAYADYKGESFQDGREAWSDNGTQELPTDIFNECMEHYELSTHIKEPLLINLLDTSTLNVNLFENGEYAGCVTITYRVRKHFEGDDALAAYLGQMLEYALRKYSNVSSSEKSKLRQALQDLVDGYQVSLNQKKVIETSILQQLHICVKIKSQVPITSIPVKYLCNMLEKEFRRSVAFEYDSSLVCFIEISAEQAEYNSYKEFLKKRCTFLLKSMVVYFGISDPFEDIHQARLYYLQACAAMDNGRLFSPEQRFYFFQDFALKELVINAIGNLPIEMYYSEGLLRLKKHDEKSGVSYIDTLYTYLNDNMSVTKTTAHLYINKSTLVERLSRIKRELKCDLNDPDERLRIQILLKAEKLNQSIHKSN